MDAFLYHKHDVLVAFGLTLFAGLATGIGGAVALFTKKTSDRLLALSLGFSAGVMIYVSFVDIYYKAQEFLRAYFGRPGGYVAAVVAFFGGIAFAAVIDRLIPPPHNVHEVRRAADARYCEPAASPEPPGRGPKLYRLGIVAALAIAIHNFPEGLATFTVSFKDLSLGIPIAIAIGLHNIPEGIAVAVPIYCATGNRRKAFLYSLLSGLAEPLAAVVGFLVLMPFLNNAVYGVLFAGVAGIMVFISLDELLPAAREYGEHHLSIYGLVAGMAVMALGLAFFY